MALLRDPKSYLPSLLLVVFLFQISWCLFVAYPIAWEHAMKKGKQWIYLPKRWNGFYRFSVIWFSRLLIIVNAGLTCVALRAWLPNIDIKYLIVTAIVSLIFFWRISQWILQSRLRQQEDSYYYFQDQLDEELDKDGKDSRQPASKNLASFRHQNLLRNADQEGGLIKALSNQSKLYQTRKTAAIAKWKTENALS